MSALIECVPNVSEGRRAEVIDAIWTALGAVPGVVLLDRSSDASHNRTVLTFVGDGKSLQEAIFRLYEVTLAQIDMRSHHGEHPRMGAVDVVPFIPVREVDTAYCVELARSVGAAVAARFGVPMFLYAEAASRPERKVLANIRKGEFEGLAAKLAQPEWQPDFGPAQPHPAAGASAIGARPFLIAYNLQLNTADVKVAKEISKSVRASSGGLQNVQAMGVSLEDRGCAQVSMNLLNFEKTPLYRVQELVKAEARRFGATVTDSEIVGLVPQAAILGAAAAYLQVGNWSPDLILEERIRAERERHLADSALPDFLARVASADPVPGGGSVAALGGSLGAALVAMVADLTRKPAFESVREQVERLGKNGAALKADLLQGVETDAKAFEAVMAALALPKEDDAQKASRRQALQDATKGAADTPLLAAEKALKVAEDAIDALTIGAPQVASDAGVAGLMALSGVEGSLLNVAINLGSIKDEAWVRERRERATALLSRSHAVRAELWKLLGDKIPEVARLQREPSVGMEV